MAGMNKSSSEPQSASVDDTDRDETRDDNRVLRFRRPGSAPAPLPRPDSPPVADLARFEQGEETGQEYKRRMAVNAAGFLFVLALVGAAIWLADTMATMRKNQDCVLSGRIGCTPVEYTPQPR